MKHSPLNVKYYVMLVEIMYTSNNHSCIHYGQRGTAPEHISDVRLSFARHAQF